MKRNSVARIPRATFEFRDGMPFAMGHVKRCHRPRNERCPHNEHPRFDCNCKSEVPVVRKPYRVIKVRLRPEFIEGRVNPNMVLEVHPDGLLVLRESKRRRRYQTNVGKVYRGCVWREAMLIAQAAKKAKKGKRRHRR